MLIFEQQCSVFYVIALSNFQIDLLQRDEYRTSSYRAAHSILNIYVCKIDLAKLLEYKRYWIQRVIECLLLDYPG